MIDDIDRSDVGCFAIAAVLVVGGAISTGVLPPTPRSQLVAGGLVVAGFALVLLCFR